MLHVRRNDNVHALHRRIQAHPKMVYCMSRWGADPSKIEKDDFPEFGSECRPIDRMPRLSCFTSGSTSRGTDLSPSSCAHTVKQELSRSSKAIHRTLLSSTVLCYITNSRQ